ncbi:thiol reductant ABC exporter subunit CydC [Schaalia sp. lx-260]|uniref:thiol reductant ABC exporter subunit CydC n=1 Tax=Schaalia sp. lx-260 TaxID=2899082 RepID=UPI001E627B0C|nr:thiol reductant ABC exporter subunit CydC [Schaalia sp. lx-260]MCD4549188.1 thiol reductant ABC exporter subunit CydC [Schaalia sp. lx-260]
MTTVFLTSTERNALRRILTLLHVNRTQFALALLLGCLCLGSAISLSATSAWLIARASQHPPVLHLTVAAVAVRLFGVLRALMRYLGRLASHHVALEGMDNLRQGIYATLANYEADTITHITRGDLLARAGADVDDVGDVVVKSILPFAVATIVGIGTIIGIAFLSPAAALILAICLLISGVCVPLVTMHATRTVEEATRSARTQLSSSIQTVMDGAPYLQVTGQLPALLHTISATESELTHTTRRTAQLQGWAAGIDRLSMGMAVIGALIVGIPATTQGILFPVLLAVIVLTPLSVFETTSELSAATAQLVRSAAAAVRINELLGGNTTTPNTHYAPAKQDTTDQRNTENLLPLQSKDEDNSQTTPHTILNAHNLAIGWPGGPTLAEDLNFTLTTNERIALVGPSGIGKTTLLLTLAGLLKPHAGTVTLNGHNIADLDYDTIFSALTVTTEDAHIFATTVLENLRVARADLSKTEATQLLSAVGLDTWLQSLPEGLNTQLGTAGTTISGGERRRLLMARALACPAPLMLLDEASEHLDTPTADTLLTELLRPHLGRAVLVISHRLSALENADTVLVMDRRADTPQAPATIVAHGTHEELLTHAHTYRWAYEQEHV